MKLEELKLKFQEGLLVKMERLITKIQCKMIGLVSPNRGMASVYDILPSQIPALKKVFSGIISSFNFEFCSQEVDGSMGLVTTKYRLDIRYFPGVS